VTTGFNAGGTVATRFPGQGVGLPDYLRGGNQQGPAAPVAHAAAPVAPAAAFGGRVNHASPIGLDRIIRRETMVGIVREIVPPQDHIGLQLCPWLEVDTDDVIFGYAQGTADGLIPARAEDAEAELAQKDDTFLGQGRASVIDWSVKDHYDPSDVARAREWLRIQELMRDGEALPLTAGSAQADFAARLVRDAGRRRRKLDNRLEWLVMSALSTGAIAYNDGRIKFAVDFGRPTAQTIVPGGTLGTATMGTAWSNTNSDPIGDIIKIQDYMFGLYAVRIKRAIMSRKTINMIMNSDRFLARSGIVVGGTPSSTIDPKYVIDGWGPTAAMAIVQQQTGLEIIEYDSVYRTRTVGSNTYVNNRFLPEGQIIFLPDEGDMNAFDDTDIGFGKMLTSPHPANNWAPGIYNWDHEYGVDPWGYDQGTGVKAFPVFPHMDLTLSYTLY
jgi:hypothetical protein